MNRPPLCLLRGGGDLATGVAWRLTRAGWPVVICELAAPLAVRRTVALSTAVTDGVIGVEGMVGRRVDNPAQAEAIVADGMVAVLVSPDLPDDIEPDVVVDARLAKRNLGTTIDDAPLVVGLGPGFTAGVDCHAVVETLRGHRLGRVLWQGEAAPDTGQPAAIAGRAGSRVVRAPAAGRARWQVAIGDRVQQGQPLGHVAEVALVAPFDGVVRGLIGDGVELSPGLKIGDVDPRAEPEACHQISDKALAIGGGVVEAVLTWARGA